VININVSLNTTNTDISVSTRKSKM